ncbi:MAG: methyltransferase domain-containing protein [Candidatus Omnitrophota bacterium]
MTKKTVLNLGCGNTRIPGTVGVDREKGEAVDLVCDLNTVPYPFSGNYADEIHMYHILEHLDNPVEKLEEAHRILKNGGLLYLRVPHFSSVYAWGDITHKRSFSLQAFDCFDKKRAFKGIRCTKVNFDITTRKIRYFYTWPNEAWYMKHVVKPIWPKYSSLILKPFILLVNFLISLSPFIFERFWCYWVGGAAEIYLIMKAVKDE